MCITSVQQSGPKDNMVSGYPWKQKVRVTYWTHNFNSLEHIRTSQKIINNLLSICQSKLKPLCFFTMHRNNLDISNIYCLTNNIYNHIIIVYIKTLKNYINWRVQGNMKNTNNLPIKKLELRLPLMISVKDANDKNLSSFSRVDLVTLELLNIAILYLWLVARYLPADAVNEKFSTNLHCPSWSLFTRGKNTFLQVQWILTPYIHSWYKDRYKSQILNFHKNKVIYNSTVLSARMKLRESPAE